MQKIGIIGIGKLGICFGLNLERSGYNVIGIDINKEYVLSINSKSLCSDEPNVSDFLKESKNLKASTSIEDILHDDITLLFVFVATPSLPDGSYDHSQIDRIVQQLKSFGKRKVVCDLVIGCTVMPGYSEKLSTELAELNYQVLYNPEFIAQGSIIYNQLHPDQILIGETSKTSGDRLKAIYASMVKNEPSYCQMDLLSAEIAKLATNCFLTMKISFANAIGDLATSSKADADKILEAIGSDSRIGNKYLKYGFGFGGPCFPRDNRALIKYAESQNQTLHLSKATDKVNEEHLTFQLNQVLTSHEDTQVITINGVTYKKGSNILEESQQLKLALALSNSGRKVRLIDTKKVIQTVKSLYGDKFEYETNDE